MTLARSYDSWADRERRLHYTREWHRTHAAKVKATKKRIQREKRQWINNYKIERGCTDCGYNADPHALDLDHRDPNEKAFEISWAMNKTSTVGWKKLLAEVAKCDVRCANCHRLRTHAEKHWLKGEAPPSVAGAEPEPPLTLFPGWGGTSPPETDAPPTPFYRQIYVQRDDSSLDVS